MSAATGAILWVHALPVQPTQVVADWMGGIYLGGIITKASRVMCFWGCCV